MRIEIIVIMSFFVVSMASSGKLEEEMNKFEKKYNFIAMEEARSYKSNRFDQSGRETDDSQKMREEYFQILALSYELNKQEDCIQWLRKITAETNFFWSERMGTFALTKLVWFPGPLIRNIEKGEQGYVVYANTFFDEKEILEEEKENPQLKSLSLANRKVIPGLELFKEKVAFFGRTYHYSVQVSVYKEEYYIKRIVEVEKDKEGNVLKKRGYQTKLIARLTIINNEYLKKLYLPFIEKDIKKMYPLVFKFEEINDQPWVDRVKR